MSRGNGDIPDVFLRAFGVGNQGDSDAQIHGLEPDVAPLGSGLFDDGEPDSVEWFVGIIARYWHGERLRRFTTASAEYHGRDLDAALDVLDVIQTVPKINSTEARLHEWERIDTGAYDAFRKQFSFGCDAPGCPDAWSADIYVMFVPLIDVHK